MTFRIEVLQVFRGMFRALIVVSCIVFCYSATCCQKRKMMMNEELRLPAEQINAFKTKAEQGDAEAAKKLWHHYTFVADDPQEGTKWEEMYYALVKNPEGAKGNQ